MLGIYEKMTITEPQGSFLTIILFAVIFLILLGVHLVFVSQNKEYLMKLHEIRKRAIAEKEKLQHHSHVS